MEVLMKWMFLAGAMALALGGAAAAQPAPSEVAGEWRGQIDGANISLPVVLHLGAAVTVDSPSENRFGIRGKLEKGDGKYKVSFDSGGVMDIALTKEGRLEGDFSKDGHSASLTLERTPAAAKPKD
jgi:hypothetical protein